MREPRGRSCRTPRASRVLALIAAVAGACGPTTAPLLDGGTGDADRSPAADTAAAPDQTPAPDSAPLRCTTTEDCAADELCRHADGACVLYAATPLDGVCEQKPASCAGANRLPCICAALRLTFEDPAAVPPWDSSNPLLAEAWAQKTAIDLSQLTPEGQTTAYGAVALHPKAPAAGGAARVAFPFVTLDDLQTPTAQRLKLMIVDLQGQAARPVSRISIDDYPRGFSERLMLNMTLDPVQLGAVAFVRWSIELALKEQQVDIGAPVALDALATVPEEARAYLAPAPMIQSDDPGIAGLAATTRAQASSVQDLVQRTLAAIAKIRKTDLSQWPADFQNDALYFFMTGWGECVAHANLFAALLRASGVPCRVVNVIARMTRGQNMHYINEYYLPGKGWILVEPQGYAAQTSNLYYVRTGVVHPSMEQLGLGYLTYKGIQQLSMIAQEVREDGTPIAADETQLAISPALVVISDPYQQLAMHAASSAWQQ